jgi:Ca-activated chloride channel family protein
MASKKNRTSGTTVGTARTPGASATESFRLRGAHGEGLSPVLRGVHAKGQLDGLLFELTLRQTYRNESGRLLEVVYTFPLPHAAVLLGFASELGGRRQEGTVVAKQVAEQRYEGALAAGDAPVMLEAGPDGLHTANIGNLKPGEELVLEVRFAQVLAFEQGRLRLVLPTTIAPRYGSAAAAGLQPQQEPQASLSAEYPLQFSLDVKGALADSTIECPTHRFKREASVTGVRLTLDKGVWLDRDLVLLVTPVRATTSVVSAAQDSRSATAPLVMMASMQVPDAPTRPALALKLLVDSSGSMGGDSIDSARTALLGVLNGLTGRDQISLTRFGSTSQRMMAPTLCSTPALKRAEFQVRAIEADLGGTEMQAALKEVFELPVLQGCSQADVLLVTDGEIWQVEEMIAAARSSGHRVFVIGVGASPAEAPLRLLAEATGGACEFATPGEALETAAARMLVRMRQAPWTGLRIDWGAQPMWQTAMPRGVFGGDTLVAFAGLPDRVVGPAAPHVVRMWVDGNDGPRELVRVSADPAGVFDVLPRLAAARRMSVAEASVATQLAVDYQLLSSHTNCILVHLREGKDKATGQAELHRVSSMLAAGWGATGSVMASSLSYDVDTLRASPSMWRSSRAPAPAKKVLFSKGARYASAMLDALDQDQAAAVRLGEVAAVQADASLTEIAVAVTDHLACGAGVAVLPTHCQSLKLPAEVIQALVEAAAIGAVDGLGWVLLAHWVNSRDGGLASTAINQALKAHLARLDPALVEVCMQVFEDRLGGHPLEVPAPSRTQRLARALSNRQGWPF